jgi:hypothetical protein
MSPTGRSRPSPALVVATLTLVAAVAGTAIADPIGKLTRKKVIKIAKAQIAQAAPNLSVAHADAAVHAETAVRADTAGNADTVGGKTAGELQATSAYAERSDDLNLTSAFQDVASTTIQSAGGRVTASADLQIDGLTNNADDDVTCLIQIAGVNGPSHTEATPDTVAGVAESVTMSLAASAIPAAGAVPVSLRCGFENGAVRVDEAELSVIATGP